MWPIPEGMRRVLGDRNDEPEYYIPLAPGHRSIAILQRTISGPSKEERVTAEREALRQEAKRLADMVRLRRQHEFLLRFAVAPVVTTLLEQHGPHEVDDRGTVHMECHGCPEVHDSDHGTYYQSWPCPTWRTISDSTGGEVGDQ